MKIALEEIEQVDQTEFKIKDILNKNSKYRLGHIFESSNSPFEMKNINIKLILKKPILILKHLVATINSVH